MQDLKGQIDGSIYHLIEFGERTPLRDFWGVFEDFEPKQEEGRRTRVILKFSELEVKETTGEPWPYLTAELDIPLSNRKKSTFGILGESVKKFFPAGGLSSARGKRVHLKLTPNHMMWDGRQNKEVPRESWEIIEVAGGTSEQPDMVSHIIKLATGKTLEEFNSKALEDQLVRGNAVILNSVLDGTLVASLVARGSLKKDTNNRYQVV